MLQQLSWGTYFMAVGIVLVCYYSVVAAIYYRTEIQKLISSGRAAQLSDQAGQAAADPEILDPFSGLEQVTNKLNSILETAGKSASKDELLVQLNEVLANYPGLRVPAYKVAVYNHIISKAEALYGIRIIEQELKG